jgi:hypothetical protein
MLYQLSYVPGKRDLLRDKAAVAGNHLAHAQIHYTILPFDHAFARQVRAIGLLEGGENRSWFI